MPRKYIGGGEEGGGGGGHDWIAVSASLPSILFCFVFFFSKFELGSCLYSLASPGVPTCICDVVDYHGPHCTIVLQM